MNNEIVYIINGIDLDQKAKDKISEIPYIRDIILKYSNNNEFNVDIDTNILKYIFNVYDNRINISDIIINDEVIINLLAEVDYMGLDINDYIGLLYKLDNKQSILSILDIIINISTVALFSCYATKKVNKDNKIHIRKIIEHIEDIENVSSYNDNILLYVMYINADLILNKYKEFNHTRLKKLISQTFFYKVEIIEFIDIILLYVNFEDLKFKLYRDKDSKFISLENENDNKYSLYITFCDYLLYPDQKRLDSNNLKVKLENTLVIDGIDGLTYPITKGMIIYLHHLYDDEDQQDIIEEYKIINIYEYKNEDVDKINPISLPYTFNNCIIEFDKEIPKLDKNKIRMKLRKKGLRVKDIFYTRFINNVYDYTFLVKLPSVYLDC